MSNFLPNLSGPPGDLLSDKVCNRAFVRDLVAQRLGVTHFGNSLILKYPAVFFRGLRRIGRNSPIPASTKCVAVVWIFCSFVYIRLLFITASSLHEPHVGQDALNRRFFWINSSPRCICAIFARATSDNFVLQHRAGFWAVAFLIVGRMQTLPCTPPKSEQSV